jgi:hypothetical protein
MQVLRPHGRQEVEPERAAEAEASNPFLAARYAEASETLAANGVSLIGESHVGRNVTEEEVTALEGLAAQFRKPENDAAIDALFPRSPGEDQLTQDLRERIKDEGEGKGAANASSTSAEPQGPSAKPDQSKGGAGQPAEAGKWDFNDRLIPPMEMFTRKITVPESGRGITDAMRDWARRIADYFDYPGEVDVGHATVDEAHVFSPPGREVRVRPQPMEYNRGPDATAVKQAAAELRSAKEERPDDPFLQIRYIRPTP